MQAPRRQKWFQFNDEEVTAIDSLYSLPSKADDDDELNLIEVKCGLTPFPVSEVPLIIGWYIEMGAVRAKSVALFSATARNLPVQKSLRSSQPEGDFDIRLLPHHLNRSRPISSKDAYMLIYTKMPTTVQPNDQSKLEEQPTPENTSIPSLLPPPMAVKEVETLNNEHSEACSRWIER